MSFLLLLFVLNGTAASHGQDSSSKRRLLQEALLPDPVSNKQPPGNSSSAPVCWGWKSTQCLTSNDMPAFALLGDSITDFGFRSYGWASLLEAAYGGAVKAINYGIPGATTRKVDALYDKFIQQWGSRLQQVKLVVVCFGANDAVKPHAPLWHLPIPKFKENLQRLVSRLQQKGITRIVLVTPPPVGQRNDRDNGLTANYTAAVTELAKELQLESVDVYSAIMAVEQWQDEALETDQLHLSSVGQRVFFNSVWQLLANSSDLSPAALGAPQQQQPSPETQQTSLVLEQAPQKQHQQQTQPKQPQKQHQQGGATVGSLGLPEEAGEAMSNVLCILVVLAFLVIVAEAKRVSPSLNTGDVVGRKLAP